jgi:hypothetical protein
MIMKKKLVLFLASLALCAGSLRSQITLEQTYPSAGWFNAGSIGPNFSIFGAKFFYMVNLEVSGQKYVSIDLQGQNINLYNLNHSLYTTISFANITMFSPGDNQEKMNATFLYFSENLFDTDNQIEFMYCNWVGGVGSPNAITQIVNQDGSILFTANGEAPLVKANFHNQYYPIYNTPQGTKMILSKTDGSARVYSLAGTFSGMMGQNPLAGNNDAFSLSPNPAGRGSAVKLEYDLPESIKEAELKVFDGAGREIKSYRIGADMHSIMVEPGELAAGVYYYSILSGSAVIGTKKSVVVE